MISFKGRNGFVKLHSIDVLPIHGGTKACVDFYTRRIGKTPPVWFEGETDDLIDLFSDIVERLKKLKEEEA